MNAERRAVDDIVRQQIEVGLDVIDDGEMGKATWITYLDQRVSGLEVRPVRVEGRASCRRAAIARRSRVPTRRLDALDEAATRDIKVGRWGGSPSGGRTTGARTPPSGGSAPAR